MGVSITSELNVFFAAIIAGLISGILYDFFCVFRSKKKLLVSLGDILLSILICSIIILVFYFYNSFILRWHMFIGLFLGIIFYFLCLSRIIVFILRKISVLFHFIFKILLTPARFLYKILLVYLFKPLHSFVVFLLGKIKAKTKKLKTDKGIVKNVRKQNKKIKHKDFNDSNSCSSVASVD